MSFKPDALPYAAAKKTANADERAGAYKVQPAELAYDDTTTLPGVDERAKATAQAAAGIQPAPPQHGFRPDAPAPVVPPPPPAPAGPPPPPNFPGTQNKTAQTQQPTGDLSGVLSGLSELFGTSLSNIPSGTLHGIHDLVSKATGNGPAPPYKAPFTPSPNAQAVGESIAGNTPQYGTVGDLLNLIPGVKAFHDQYIAPVKQDVGQIGAGVGVVAPLTRVAGAALSNTAAAAEAASPAGQLGFRTAQPHPIAAAGAGSTAGPTL